MFDEIGDLILQIKRYGIESVFRRYYSIYRAQVTDVKDPQKRCRVKLSVPDLFGKEPLANWAEPVVNAGKDKKQISSKTGGSYMGSFHPPKVGDWLWVSFEKGHSSFPLYHPTGWVGDEELNDVVGGATDWNMINPIFISRYGHTIFFDETKGKAKFQIETNAGQKFVISEESGKELISLEDKAGNKFLFDTAAKNCAMTVKNNWTVDVDKNVTIKSGGDTNIECTKASIKASGDASVEGANVNVKATANANIEATANVNIKGTAQVKIEGTSQVEVKGAVTNVGGSGVTNIKGSVVMLAGGGAPIAKIGSQGVGVGNLGIPVMVTIISGSAKVMAP